MARIDDLWNEIYRTRLLPPAEAAEIRAEIEAQVVASWLASEAAEKALTEALESLDQAGGPGVWADEETARAILSALKSGEPS